MADVDEEAENLIDKATVAAQMGVLAVIAERLGKIGKAASYDVESWEVADFIAIESAVKRGRQLIDRAIAKAMDALDKANYEWASAYYRESGAAESAEASAVIVEGRKDIAKRANSLCRTSVMGIMDRHGNVVPLREGYREAVSRAVAAMRAGEAAYQTEIARTSGELARHGLRVRYESGYTRELYASVRTNVMDGYRTVMTAQRFAHAKAFGYDGVEVSAHFQCAPDHQPYQGQRYSLERWREIEGTLGRPLVTGANCRHTVSPVILAVGKPSYSAEEIKAMNSQSNETVRFRGVGGKAMEMSRYDATQYQRGIEREIRRSRADAYLLENEGLKGEAMAASRRADDCIAYYRSMSRQAGLTRRDERTRLYV